MANLTYAQRYEPVVANLKMILDSRIALQEKCRQAWMALTEQVYKDMIENPMALSPWLDAQRNAHQKYVNSQAYVESANTAYVSVATWAGTADSYIAAGEPVPPYPEIPADVQKQADAMGLSLEPLPEGAAPLPPLPEDAVNFMVRVNRMFYQASIGVSLGANYQTGQQMWAAKLPWDTVAAGTLVTVPSYDPAKVKGPPAGATLVRNAAPGTNWYM